MANPNLDKVIKFISDKWGNSSCPMCKNGSFEVQEKVFQLNEFKNGNLIVGGPLIPIVPVTCKNCGNTILVNALISGAVDKEDKTGGEKGNV